MYLLSVVLLSYHPPLTASYLKEDVFSFSDGNPNLPNKLIEYADSVIALWDVLNFKKLDWLVNRD